MAISIDNLTKLEELFVKKNWEIVKETAMFSSLFNRFCNRLDLFDSNKQSFLIELGHNFIDLGLNDFQPCFIDAIKKNPQLNDYKAIIVSPLKAPSVKETKSSDAIWYHLKSYSDFSYEVFHKKLFFLSDWDNVQQAMQRPDTLLVLIDDFIGTGKTVVDTIEELKILGHIKENDKISIVTFMAQESGVKLIQSVYGEIVYFSIGLQKALTDKYSGDELSKRTIMMKEMESKIKVLPEFEFGFGHSESLVSVSRRSANNTFPVYWLEKKKKLAPFKR
jgi:hypothetical protein